MLYIRYYNTCKYCEKKIFMTPYASAHNKAISSICRDCQYIHSLCLSMKGRNKTMPDFYYVKELLSQNECSYCHYTLLYAKKHIDHIIPVSRGGTNDNSNLCICCSWCNEQKQDKTGDEYRQFLNEHPEEIRKRNRQNAKNMLLKYAAIKTVFTQKKEIVREIKNIDEMIAEGGIIFDKYGRIKGVKEGYNRYKEKEVVKTVKSYLYMNKEAEMVELMDKMDEVTYD